MPGLIPLIIGHKWISDTHGLGMRKNPNVKGHHNTIDLALDCNRTWRQNLKFREIPTSFYNIIYMKWAELLNITKITQRVKKNVLEMPRFHILLGRRGTVTKSKVNHPREGIYNLWIKSKDLEKHLSCADFEVSGQDNPTFKEENYLLASNKYHR